MALTMYIGSAGVGKTHALMEHIIKESMKHPRTQYLCIVPEQATMETQKQLVLLHPYRAIMNIDVLSFNRLAYRVFSEIGAQTGDLLEEIGKTFLLEKIALEEKKNLAYFGTTLARPGNLAEMKSLLSELMLYGVSPQMLEDIQTSTDTPAAADDRASASVSLSGALSGKLRDIITVYRDFQKKTDGRFLVREEVPDRLCEIADRSSMLKDSVIALDGFTGFTPVQLRLIEKLLPIVQNVYVTVTMDPASLESAPKHRMDLFHFSSETVTSLKNLAAKTGVNMNPPVMIRRTDESRASASKDLTFLSDHIFRRQRAAKKDECEDIEITSCANPREEIEEAALFISRKVRTGGYRWRDFAIVTGDLTTYDNYVQQVFSEWKIPFFLDEKRALLANPFMEYVRAALEACTSSYSYEGIFRMLRTGMADFTKEEVDHLENYVLGRGIRGKKKWREKWIHPYYGEDAGEVPLLDEVRGRVCALLDPLADVFSSRTSTVREKTTALYEFFVRSGAEQKLADRAACFEAGGDYAKAREYSQVYPYIIGFLDKLVAVLGDEKISMKDYQALLEAGFSEARVAVIPPGADQVLIGDMERSRLGEVKYLLFVGVNEGLIPRNPPEGGILSEADRALLLVHDIQLRPTNREAMAIERYYLYLTLTKPSENLWLSYSRTSADGDAIHPAYLIEILKSLFPSLCVRLPSEAVEDRMEKKETGMHILTRQMELLGECEPDPAFYELFSYYAHDPDYADQAQMLLRAAGKRKPADVIGRAAADALYGKNLTGSASRLETFCQCAMRQFLQYGLRLKERPDYSFQPVDMGSIMHRSLELFGRQTGGQVSWADLADSEETRNQYADKCMKTALDEAGLGILKESARDAYAENRMTRLLRTTAWAQAKQLANGDFTPASFEQEFREEGQPGGVTFSLGDDRVMSLRGKIDRIDTAVDGDMTYVKIVDYKTGTKKFDLDDVYYGLQMQLILYLDAVLDLYQKKGRPVCPAGIFYYNVQDPIVDYDPTETEEDTARRILKSLKVSGAIMKDRQAVAHLDHAFRSDGKVTSDVIPCSTTQKGDFAKTGGPLLTVEQFKVLESYVRRIAQKAGRLILNGKADANPYAFSENDYACMYCPVRGSCGFDRNIPGYSFRKLEKKNKADDIIKSMEDSDGVDSGSKESH